MQQAAALSFQGQAACVAITMGDPAGVGPEIIAGAWPTLVAALPARPVVFGSAEVMRRAARLLRAPLEVSACTSLAAALDQPAAAHMLTCFDPCDASAADALPGRASAQGGQAAFAALNAAITAALENKVQAIVTAPLNKHALHLAGHMYPGHTEILAERCGITDFAMLLYQPPGPRVLPPAGLGVAHVTLHCALARVFEQLTTDRVLGRIRLLHHFMAQLLCSPPRIGVCGLNPHAGEEGLFGQEEITIIRPAVEQAAREGLRVTGPFGADSLLARACAGEFDGVVAMYHDQGHVALKLLGMHGAVNITLGLPIVRTSVAHGTAFDIAWQGKADWHGLVIASQIACQLAGLRQASDTAVV